MVWCASKSNSICWTAFIRINLYRALLHFDIIVELQVLSRLRIPFGSVCHPLFGGVHDYHYCGILLSQLGELSVAMDCILLGIFDSIIRLPLLHLLLCVQDEYEWVGADFLLLWIHAAD